MKDERGPAPLSLSTPVNMANERAGTHVAPVAAPTRGRSKPVLWSALIAAAVAALPRVVVNGLMPVTVPAPIVIIMTGAPNPSPDAAAATPAPAPSAGAEPAAVAAAKPVAAPT